MNCNFVIRVTQDLLGLGDASVEEVTHGTAPVGVVLLLLQRASVTITLFTYTSTSLWRYVDCIFIFFCGCKHVSFVCLS